MLGFPMLRLLFSFSGFFVVVEVWYALTAHLEIKFKVKKTGTERFKY